METKELLVRLSESIKNTSNIPKSLFKEMGVKRGLRNENHSGVLAGLTRVGDVVGYEKQEDGNLKPIPGELYYRGINVANLVHGIQKDDRLGFEETAFLLLSGELPTKDELKRRSSNKSGFNNVQSGDYWSSTSFAGNEKGAWYVSMSFAAAYTNKNKDLYVWPVRAGQ